VSDIEKYSEDGAGVRDKLVTAMTDLETTDEGIEELEKLLEEARDTATCGELLTESKAEHKRLEANRKDLVEVPNKLVKAINAEFKARQTRLERVSRVLESRMSDALAAAAAAQAEAWRKAAEAEAAGQDLAMRAALSQSAKHADTKLPSNHNQRKRWVATVVDSEAVPREWCVPDISALRRAAHGLAADAKPPEIPGVEFTVKIVTTTRT